MRIISNIFTLSIGYYIGRNYSGPIESIIDNARKTDEPPLRYTDEGIHVFGYKVIGFKK